MNNLSFILSLFLFFLVLTFPQNSLAILDRCGNRIVGEGEQCDDGNTRSGDGCSATCRRESGIRAQPTGRPHDRGIITARPRRGQIVTPCGNGHIEGREECDDGNRVNEGDSCRNNCKRPACGDGVVDENEHCDDGNLDSGDGCNASCRHEIDCEGTSCSAPPSGITCRDYPDARHFSQCTGDRSVEYTICGSGGEITVSNEPCPPGHRCTDGICVEDMVWCFDSDGGSDPFISGMVRGRDGYHYTARDWCHNLENSVVENFCIPGGIHRATTIPCGEERHCEEGACVEGRIEGIGTTPSCVDNDATNNPDARESVLNTPAFGEPWEILDNCECPDLSVVWEATCIDGRGTLTAVSCSPGRLCWEGRCVPAETVPETACESASESCSCSRTPATSSVAGYVQGSDCAVQHDICECADRESDLCEEPIQGDTLVQFRCDPDGDPTPSERIPCPRGCRDGLCL